MRNRFKLALFLFTLIFISRFAYADGILLAWSARDVEGITEESFNAAKQMSVADILKKNLSVTSWPETFLLMVGANQNKQNKDLLKGLVSQLTNRTKSNLKATSMLIVWERISSGEIMFEGKGYQVEDDLFTVAGRANWMLRNLTGKNFGHVKLKTTEEELGKLQQKWSRWLNGEQVEEYRSEYVSAEKGLEELRSPEAVEALVTSLKPGGEKERLTKDCLKRLYNLDKLPDDPNAPAALCSPDKYTHNYLKVITGIEDRHDYAWWKSWWDTNRNQFAWNRAKAIFEVKSK